MSHIHVPSNPPPRDSHPATDRPTDATPYLAELILLGEHADGSLYLNPVESPTLAPHVAALVSPHPELTEPIDPEHGMWNVWLPNYMTKDWYMYGVDLEVTVGAFRIKISYEKV